MILASHNATGGQPTWGRPPPEFVTIDMEVSDHGTYHHDEGGGDEWSLMWTKIDDTPIAD